VSEGVLFAFLTSVPESQGLSFAVSVKVFSLQYVGVDCRSLREGECDRKGFALLVSSVLSFVARVVGRRVCGSWNRVC
jgi:hypothetical protein